jgi:hypothetical protein
VHILDIVFDLIFVAGDLVGSSNWTCSRVCCIGKQVKGEINLLMLDEEFTEEGLDTKGVL